MLRSGRLRSESVDGLARNRWTASLGIGGRLRRNTQPSDGQMLFLANKLSKMKQGTRLGSRIAEIHNGSSLFTGSAGQGESNIRRPSTGGARCS